MPELTVQAAVDGLIKSSDLAMDPAVLIHQAELAAANGNPQLADNLRRAAELVGVDDDEVLAIYEALRPYRSTLIELESLATSLRHRHAPLCADLVAEAAATYRRRGLLR